MAEWKEGYWVPRIEGMTRDERRECVYQAYCPDVLHHWDLLLSASDAGTIASVEEAIVKLNTTGLRQVNVEGLARYLLRAESVSSSHIEGLRVHGRRLARAEAAFPEDIRDDELALEVLGNIRAMEVAVATGTTASDFSINDLCAIHKTLMQHSSTPQYGGVLRVEQNWIGGNSYNPCAADYIPPPPEYVVELLDDLLNYVNTDHHSPLVQAALVHAQFETIHPFADGNGRTGRALIHVVLARRGLAPHYVPPISLALATRSSDYIAGLSRFRHNGGPTSPERSEATMAWVHVFAEATRAACVDATEFAGLLAEQEALWRVQLGNIRKGSALDLILRVLPGTPIVNGESVAKQIGRSKARCIGALNRLLEVGILKQRNLGKKRYRVFEAPSVFELWNRVDRALATPGRDTQIVDPVRAVPSRIPTL